MRKILEDLIFIGKEEETYKLFGKDWTLKTLTSDEQLEATSSTGDYDNVSRISALKLALLARSLTSVNGVELKDLKEKIEFLGKLPQSILDILFEKYNELQKRQDDTIKNMDEELKN